MATLITGATSARAYQIKSTLTDNEIYLGDYEELPQVMIDSGRMLKLPKPGGAAYIHEILALCLDRDIIEIYPLHQAEADLLNEAKQLYSEYGININAVQ